MANMDNDSLVSGLQLFNRLSPLQDRGTGSDNLLYVAPTEPENVTDWAAYPSNLKPEDKRWFEQNGWHWDEENGWWGFHVF